MKFLTLSAAPLQLSLQFENDLVVSSKIELYEGNFSFSGNVTTEEFKFWSSSFQNFIQYGKPFENVWDKLNLSKLTSFQSKAFFELQKTQAGTTRSYQNFAKILGNPNLARALGQALRRNPYPVLIPCHRIVRADGSSGGFLGEEDSKLKKILLLLEKSYSDPVLPIFAPTIEILKIA